MRPSRGSFLDSFSALDTNRHVFILWMRSSKVQSFIITVVCLDSLISETGQNFSISIGSGWVSSDHLDKYAWLLCLSTTLSAFDAFIMVQVKDDINL